MPKQSSFIHFTLQIVYSKAINSAGESFEGIKPRYSPDSSGKAERTFLTTHDGIGLLLPMPRYPCTQAVKALYAVFLQSLKKTDVIKTHEYKMPNRKAKKGQSITTTCVNGLFK